MVFFRIESPQWERMADCTAVSLLLVRFLFLSFLGIHVLNFLCYSPDLINIFVGVLCCSGTCLLDFIGVSGSTKSLMSKHYVTVK